MVAGTAAGVDLGLALPRLRSSAARWLLRPTAITGRTTDITDPGITDIGIMGRGGTTGTAGGDGIIGRGIIGTAGAAIAGIIGDTGNGPPVSSHGLRASVDSELLKLAQRAEKGCAMRVARSKPAPSHAWLIGISILQFTPSLANARSTVPPSS